MQFSERLHEIGLTQYAIAIAKRAADIALGQNDLNSLTTLSRRLKTLGRGHDAQQQSQSGLRALRNRPSVPVKEDIREDIHLV